MPELINNKKANFGTMPVFVTAISTILGAVLSVFACKLIQTDDCCDNC